MYAHLNMGKEALACFGWLVALKTLMSGGADEVPHIYGHLAALKPCLCAAASAPKTSTAS